MHRRSFLKWLAVLPMILFGFSKIKATSEPKEDCVPDVISSPDVSVMVEISHRPNDSSGVSFREQGKSLDDVLRKVVNKFANSHRIKFYLLNEYAFGPKAAWTYGSDKNIVLADWNVCSRCYVSPTILRTKYREKSTGTMITIDVNMDAISDFGPEDEVQHY